MKYAMIAINKKLDENDNLLIRRVLISYTKKENKLLNGVHYITFKGTKIIDTDNYFKEERSHKYLFEDDSYKLVKCDNNLKELYPDSFYELREYHAYCFGEAKPILFRAKSNEEAIEKFNFRDELR